MTETNIVSVSGGKDSTATLLLAIERGVDNIQAVFADTGNEHPQTYEYVDYLEQATGIKIRTVKADFKARIAKKRETVVTKWAKDGVSQEIIDEALSILVTTGNPFLDMCLVHGRFPSRMTRFCTDELKIEPMMDKVYIPATKLYDRVLSWQGVRADESRSRSTLPESDVGEFGVINYRPILHWTAEMAFEQHRKHGVKWNPLYEQGMNRVGCMPCIMVRKDELAQIEMRFPKELDRIARWEELVNRSSKRINTDQTFLNSTAPAKVLGPDIKTKTHGIGFMRKYALTTRGGRQDDLIYAIQIEEDAPTCLSSYGLCE